MKPLSLYIHWPFCLSKCPYCDFNSHLADQVNHERWLRAFKTELSYFKQTVEGERIASIFFGGGTPSLMKPFVVEGILNHVHDLWQVEKTCEITLEANPTSIESKKFREFRAAGINRVSIGVQALNDQDLKFLGRTHSAQDARTAIDIADCIFERRSIDLIYARPQQTLQEWEDELRRALKIIKGHAALYQLTIEQGTPFYTQHKRGDFSVPCGDEGADLYDLTHAIMEEAGMSAYEISNYARKGEESTHNMAYWRYRDYLGVGPGAHGRVRMKEKKYATRTHRAPDIWLARVEERGEGLQECTLLSQEDQDTERLMMGLRLHEGVDIENMNISKESLDRLIHEGDITLCAHRVKATHKGRLRLNSVLGHLLAA